MPTWKPVAIKNLRKSLKETQAAFGNRIGVSGNYVHLLEKGDRTPSTTLCFLLDFIKKEQKERR